MQNLKIKELTIESFGKDLELYIDELINKELDKLIIKTPFKHDCVVIPIETYERLKNLYEKVKNQNIEIIFMIIDNQKNTLIIKNLIQIKILLQRIKYIYLIHQGIFWYLI